MEVVTRRTRKERWGSAEVGKRNVCVDGGASDSEGPEGAVDAESSPFC